MPAIHLHHEGAGEGPPARPRRPQGHLALVSPGREDRRARPQRRGQEHAAADHGGRGSAAFVGEAWPAEGISVGFLHQEPRLDPAKTVLGNVEEGVAEIQALLTRYDEINAKFGEELSPEEMDKVLEEQGEGAGPDRGRQRLGPRLAARARDGRAAAAAARRRRHDALGRRAAPRRALPAAAASRPTCCCSTSRRTISTPSRSPGSSASSRTIRAPSSPSPTIATSSTTSPAGFSSSIAARAFRGKATTRPGSSRSRSASRSRRRRESKRQRTLAARARLDPHVAARAPGQGQGPPQRVRGAARRRRPRRRSSRSRSTSRPGPRLGDIVVEARGLRKGYGDQLLMDDVNFTLPRGGIVGVIGPNGAGKTTLFRMITGQEQPDGGTLRLGETVQGRLRRSVARRAQRRQDRLGGDHRRQRRGGARQARGRVARLRVVVQLQGARPAAQGRRALGRRAQPRAPGEAAEGAAATCCCSTSRPTTSTSTRCARSKRRCWHLPAAPSSSATTAGSSTASPRTSSRSKATARSSGSKATTRTTKPIGTAASAPRPTSRTGSSTGS